MAGRLSREADAVAVHAKTGALVHCLYSDPETVARARRSIRDAGACGEVSADKWDGRRLPYVDGLINAVVADPSGDLLNEGLTLAELGRVVAPRGLLLLGRGDADVRKDLVLLGFDVGTAGAWTKAVRRWPADIDMWGHFCHGPDGNPVANDLRVGPPAHYQWIAGPVYLRAHDADSSLNALVSSNGRLFYVVDDAPISLPGRNDLPDDWHLAARDAFNGRLLWKLPLPDWGWRAWKSSWFQARPGDFPLNIQRRVVADGDVVYATLGYRAPVSRIDAATGKVLLVYVGTERANEILCLGGKLVVSALRDGGLQVMRLDARTGATDWATPPRFKGTTKDYFVPGDKGYLLFAQGHDAKKPSWSVRVPVRATAMARAGDRLVIAGPPDLSDLDAFAGRQGGRLWLLDAATGEKRVEHSLVSPPVFNGIAVADGRLFLTLVSGQVACFGGPP